MSYPTDNGFGLTLPPIPDPDTYSAVARHLNTGSQTIDANYQQMMATHAQLQQTWTGPASDHYQELMQQLMQSHDLHMQTMQQVAQAHDQASQGLTLATALAGVADVLAAAGAIQAGMAIFTAGASLLTAGIEEAGAEADVQGVYRLLRLAMNGVKVAMKTPEGQKELRRFAGMVVGGTYGIAQSLLDTHGKPIDWAHVVQAGAMDAVLGGDIASFNLKTLTDPAVRSTILRNPKVLTMLGGAAVGATVGISADLSSGHLDIGSLANDTFMGAMTGGTIASNALMSGMGAALGMGQVLTGNGNYGGFTNPQDFERAFQTISGDTAMAGGIMGMGKAIGDTRAAAGGLNSALHPDVSSAQSLLDQPTVAAADTTPAGTNQAAADGGMTPAQSTDGTSAAMPGGGSATAGEASLADGAVAAAPQSTRDAALLSPTTGDATQPLATAEDNMLVNPMAANGTLSAGMPDELLVSQEGRLAAVDAQVAHQMESITWKSPTQYDIGSVGSNVGSAETGTTLLSEDPNPEVLLSGRGNSLYRNKMNMDPVSTAANIPPWVDNPIGRSYIDLIRQQGIRVEWNLSAQLDLQKDRGYGGTYNDNPKGGTDPNKIYVALSPDATNAVVYEEYLHTLEAQSRGWQPLGNLQLIQGEEIIIEYKVLQNAHYLQMTQFEFNDLLNGRRTTYIQPLEQWFQQYLPGAWPPDTLKPYLGDPPQPPSLPTSPPPRIP